jgi:CubicO group peptidase (beta-lactamase class C family)
MSKTVTGIATALLRDDGKLSLTDKVASFFPEAQIHPGLSELTVENLLVMSSGVGFAELGTVCEDDWVQTFLSSAPAYTPGNKFSYNSMNSYLIARICDKITHREYGKSLIEYIEERLFAPLGIESYLWERDRGGVIKGGWGLYMSTESWARLGVLMLDLGVYRGKRIISEKHVVDMISTHSLTPPDTGDYNYGYHVWVSREDDSFVFSGMLGQNVWVCPKNRIVVALTSGNNEFFQKSPALDIIKKHLGADNPGAGKSNMLDYARYYARLRDFFKSRMTVTPKDKPRSLGYILGLRRRLPFDESFAPLIGEYAAAKNNQGMLPIFVRAMQNNYQGGIEKIKLARGRGSLLMTLTEGGKEYEYEFGFYGYTERRVDYNGEAYLTSGVCSHVTIDNSDAFIFELIYPELPNTRLMKLTKDSDGKLAFAMYEIPNEKIADSLIKSIPTMNPSLSFAFDMLEGQLGKNFIENKVRELFAPVIIAVDTAVPRYGELLAAENVKIESRLSSYKLVRALIERFGASDEEGEGENNTAKKNPFSFFARLFRGGDGV